MHERLVELCAKAAQVPQYCEYGAGGPVQRRVSAPTAFPCSSGHGSGCGAAIRRRQLGVL